MRILALRALGLGDLLTAVPALRALKDHHPDADLALATTPAMAALAGALPGVDRVMAVEELGALPATEVRPDLAVNLHGSGPESHRRLLDLDPARMIAFRHPAVPQVHGPDWDAHEHEVVRWCRLLEASGIPADPTRRAVDPPPGSVPPRALGATVVHPGAKSAARRWPADRFAAVAHHAHATGHRVVVTGSPGERGLAERVARDAELPSASVLAGRTDVVDLLRVVAAAGRVVCGDTGVAHVASATGTPSVVLFGPMDPARWGPPDRPEHTVIWHGREGDPLADEPFPGLLDIAVSEVVAAMDDLPYRGRRAVPTMGRTPRQGAP